MANLIISYFGKVPARADFVKASSDRMLSDLLDQWLADVMAQLMCNPRWRQHYDVLRPLHFAFIGTRNHAAIAGHLAASRDRSERRFPFMAMSALRVDDPLAFLPCSPLALATFWEQLSEATADVQTAHEPGEALSRLGGLAVEVVLEGENHSNAMQSFFTQATLADVDMLLGVPGTTRRLILALGLLLRPLSVGSDGRLEKSLVLPLPASHNERMLLCAFWLALATTFLRRSDIELVLFLCEREGRHQLVAGFSGASADTLQAVIDPEFAVSQQIALEDNDWLDGELASAPGAEGLSARLSQSRLPLDAVLRLFRETFV
jgi:type VI secretion system protein ImpM